MYSLENLTSNQVGITVKDVEGVIKSVVNGRDFTGDLLGDIQLSRVQPITFSVGGFKGSLSVQASSYHYCTPRANTDEYTHVEVGFPNFNFSDAFIQQYAEDKNHPQETVYGYVPIHILAVELHHFITSKISN